MSAHEQLIKWGFAFKFSSTEPSMAKYLKGASGLNICVYVFDNTMELYFNDVYAPNCKTLAQLYSLLYMFDLIKK